MKRKLSRLSRCYASALRKHLKQGPRAGLQPALRLGFQAVALGLETLELARVHERALRRLELSSSRNGLIKRAKVFLAEAIIPIVETHRAGRKSRIQLHRLQETLRVRTLELAATNRRLQRGLIRRRSLEAALSKSSEYYTRLLQDSLHFQEGLRDLTHRILSVEERERETISHRLQDEIAQTLLGIQVRLLTLKTAARGDTAHLTKRIASAQRLVEESVQSINRVAHGLDLSQPA